MKHRIQNVLKEYGYTVNTVTRRSFVEANTEFTVFTVELNEMIDDYDTLLKTEKEISNKMGLYDKNIILELL